MKRTVKDMMLDGGCYCFDFTNTVHSRTEEDTYDYINSYTDIIDWSERVKLLPYKRLKKLKEYAEGHKKEAERTLDEILKNRELLYEVFASVTRNKNPEGSILGQFNESLSDSLSKLRFHINKRNITVAWEENTLDLMEPLWVIYKNAFDIITSTPVNRIKECKSCGWLFLDKSKNNSRTWCNMQSCGSIVKSKRYYYNTKKARES